jgi:hypothetical protein
MHWSYFRGCERFKVHVFLPVEDRESECAVCLLISDLDVVL